MIQLLIPSIVSPLIFFLAIPVFSGAMDYRTMHRCNQIGSRFSQGPIHTTNSKNPKSRFPWKQKAKKFNHKHHPYRFIYDPRVYFYGSRYPEQKEKVEINIIIDENEKDATKELPAKKEKTYSPPHIFNLDDSGPNRKDNHLRSAKSNDGVILIHGTSVRKMEHLKE